jgi:uncharacterized heparinase superfamily protein
MTPSGKPMGRTGKDGFALRFHLHSQVNPRKSGNGRTIELVLPDGEVWAFEVANGEAVLEDSMYFSEIRGNAPSQQIVVYGRPQATPQIAWRIRRVGLSGRTRITSG